LGADDPVDDNVRAPLELADPRIRGGAEVAVKRERTKIRHLLVEHTLKSPHSRATGALLDLRSTGGLFLL
jgi:hypothetical protein